MAARFFIVTVMGADCLSDEMNAHFYQAEGWGDYCHNGIRMKNFIGGPPEYDFDDIEVVEDIN